MILFFSSGLPNPNKNGVVLLLYGRSVHVTVDFTAFYLQAQFYNYNLRDCASFMPMLKICKC